MTLSSRHRIWNSSPGGLRPSTLPLGHGGSPQYWLSHVDGEETFFVSFKPPRPGNEPRTLAWKAAVLTTTLGPPPKNVSQCHPFFKEDYVILKGMPRALIYTYSPPPLPPPPRDAFWVNEYKTYPVVKMTMIFFFYLALKNRLKSHIFVVIITTVNSPVTPGQVATTSTKKTTGRGKKLHNVVGTQ